MKSKKAQLTEKEKRQLLITYVDATKRTFSDFAIEVGYTKGHISAMKTGKRTVPDVLIWGIQQSFEGMRCNSELEKFNEVREAVREADAHAN